MLHSCFSKVGLLGVGITAQLNTCRWVPWCSSWLVHLWYMQLVLYKKVTSNVTSYQRMRKPCEVHTHLALSAELMVHKPNLALQLRTCIKLFVLICMLHLHVHNHVCSSNDSSYPNCIKLSVSPIYKMPVLKLEMHLINDTM